MPDKRPERPVGRPLDLSPPQRLAHGESLTSQGAPHCPLPSLARATPLDPQSMICEEDFPVPGATPREVGSSP